MTAPTSAAPTATTADRANSTTANHATERTTTPLSPTELRSAWASIPTPITTLAAVVDGRPIGLIVGSYVGLSLEPALVAVSVQKTSRSWPLLRAADHLGISVLTADHVTAVLEVDRVAQHAPSAAPLVFHGSQVTTVGEL